MKYYRLVSAELCIPLPQFHPTMTPSTSMSILTRVFLACHKSLHWFWRFCNPRNLLQHHKYLAGCLKRNSSIQICFPLGRQHTIFVQATVPNRIGSPDSLSFTFPSREVWATMDSVPKSSKQKVVIVYSYSLSIRYKNFQFIDFNRIAILAIIPRLIKILI